MFNSTSRSNPSLLFPHKKHHSSLLPVHGTRSISDKASAQDRHGSTMRCVCQVSIILLVGKHQKTIENLCMIIAVLANSMRTYEKLQIGIPISFVSRCLQDITPTLKAEWRKWLRPWSQNTTDCLNLRSTRHQQDSTGMESKYEIHGFHKTMVFLFCESCVSPGFDLQIYASSTICMSMYEK